jgi:hypothetical protein
VLLLLLLLLVVLLLLLLLLVVLLLLLLLLLLLVLLLLLLLLVLLLLLLLVLLVLVLLVLLVLVLVLLVLVLVLLLLMLLVLLLVVVLLVLLLVVLLLTLLLLLLLLLHCMQPTTKIREIPPLGRRARQTSSSAIEWAVHAAAALPPRAPSCASARAAATVPQSSRSSKRHIAKGFTDEAAASALHRRCIGAASALSAAAWGKAWCRWPYPWKRKATRHGEPRKKTHGS